MPEPQNNPLFRVVSAEPEAPPAPTQQEQAVATKMIYMALAALGQRFVVAVAAMFTMLTVASAFVLWLLTPDPNTKQLIGMGMYCLFLLSVNFMVIRSRSK